MKIYLGADHGGYQLKEKIKVWLDEWGYPYADLGNLRLDDSDDYPDFAFKVGEAVAQKPNSRGILACRSGVGMAIAANKIKGIRAVAPVDEASAVHSRSHNDTNILALSGDSLSDEKAKKVLKTWIETKFSNEERHRRRLAKISTKETNDRSNSGNS